MSREPISFANLYRLAAQAYAAGGLEVFPLVPENKNPLIPKAAGGRGFHDATTDAAVIEAWWRRWPDANIGGRIPADMFVIDVDGAIGLDWLRGKGYALVPTLVTATGREGGYHYWYRIDPGEQVRPFSRDGVQIKTHDSGYVVLPPSLHPDGLRYRFATDVPLAEVPYARG